MHVRLRKIMMGSLLLAFVGQTTLVYADSTADRTPPLSEAAIVGRELWHEHNCQACHQIYGFGGFLGPDLTNAGGRLAGQTDYLTKVLGIGPNDGNSQMPAFHFDADQISAIEAFLIELDKTGVGVPRAFLQPAPSEVFDAVKRHAATAPAAVQQGLALFQPVCGACHTPLCATALGPHTAPDLSTLCDRMADAEIVKTISEGRVDRGMPAWPLGEPVETQILPFLKWLQTEREAISGQIGSGTESPLPWWEFK